MSNSAGRNLIKLAVLAVVAAIATQAVIYWVHVSTVQKTLVAQIMVYQQRGVPAYRAAVVRELAIKGMEIAPEALVIVEDRAGDEMRATLEYEWPHHVLWITLDRPNVAKARTTILDA